MRRPLFWMGVTILSTTAMLLLQQNALSCGLLLFSLLFWTALAGGNARRTLGTLGGVVLLTIGWFSGWTAMMDWYFAPIATDEPLSITLTLTEVSGPAYRQRCTGWATLSVDGNTRIAPLTLLVSDAPELRPGETAAGEILLEALPEPLSGEPLTARGITVAAAPTPSLHRPLVWLLSARNAAEQYFCTLWQGKAEAIFLALLTGSKAGLHRDPALTAAFRESGTSHLLALSGLHLVLLTSLLRQLFASFRPKRRAGLLLFFLWSFYLFTGARVSLLRAGLMLSLSLVGELLGRRSDTLTSVAAAAACMVLLRPYLLREVSFLLSVSAVFGIGMRGELSARRYPRRPCHPLLENFSTTVAATLATLPVLLLFFGELPLVGLLANLPAIFLLSPVLLSGILAAILGWLPLVGTGLIAISAGLAGLLVRVVETASDWGLPMLYLTAPWQTFLLLGSLPPIFYALSRWTSRRSWCRLMIGLVSCWLVVMLFAQHAAQSTVSVLESPDGSGVLLVKQQQAVLLGVPSRQREGEALWQAAEQLGAKQLTAVLLPQDVVANERCLLGQKNPPHFYGNSSSQSAFLTLAEISLLPPEQLQTLFGSAVKFSPSSERILIFSGGGVLKSGENCAILTAYPAPLPALGDCRQGRIGIGETT